MYSQWSRHAFVAHDTHIHITTWTVHKTTNKANFTRSPPPLFGFYWRRQPFLFIFFFRLLHVWVVVYNRSMDIYVNRGERYTHTYPLWCSTCECLCDKYCNLLNGIVWVLCTGFFAKSQAITALGCRFFLPTVSAFAMRTKRSHTHTQNEKQSNCVFWRRKSLHITNLLHKYYSRKQSVKTKWIK